MGIYLSKTLILKQVKSPLAKMKGALLFIGFLVCVSMIEASSVRRAKNPFKAIQNRHIKTTVAKGVRRVSETTGCGYDCDLEFYFAYTACSPYGTDDKSLSQCMGPLFGSDCHDCLCNWFLYNTGYSCP